MQNIEITKIKNSRGAANTYVVKCNGKAVVIDAACSVKELKNALNGVQLAGVIITHGHFDHILTLDEILKAFPDIYCYLHKYAIDKLRDPIQNGSEPTVKQALIIQTDASRFKTVDEGDALELFDEKILILETPGHTNCSICIKIGGNIFAGDTLFAGGYYGRTDLPTGSAAQMRQSLRRLKKDFAGLPFYSGHGEEGII